MQRRAFLRNLVGLSLAPAAGYTAPEPSARIPIALQESPIAGFQYHQGEVVWPRLRPGDPLRLVREPANRHDPRAVAVYWCDAQLGYLPRAENSAVAYLLDNGRRLHARIVRLKDDPSPWERVRFIVNVGA